MNETWKPVDAEGWYEVSSLGRVRSWRIQGHKGRAQEPRLLKPSTDHGGYKRVSLTYSARHTYGIHRLVCIAFHGPAPAGQEAAHRNGIPHDNRVDNLRWATPVENAADRKAHGTERHRAGVEHPRSRLTESQVREIRRLASLGRTQQSIADEFGIERTATGKIINRINWKHIT